MKQKSLKSVATLTTQKCLAPLIPHILLLCNVGCRHGLHFYCYADDVRLYISSTAITATLHCTLTHCLTEIKSWIELPSTDLWKSRLKTYFPQTSQKNHPQQPLFSHSSFHLRNKGIILDSRLLLENHTNHITKKISFHLKTMTSLSPPLFLSTTENFWSTHSSDPDSDLSKPFGKVWNTQSSAARLLYQTHFHDHIDFICQNLHCNPITHRIHFKLPLTHKTLHNLASIQNGSTTTFISSHASVLCAPSTKPGAFLVFARF